LVFVEGDGEVVEEREDAWGVAAEIEGFALFATAPAFGCAGRLGPGVPCVAFINDAIVSGKEGDVLGLGKGLEIGTAGGGNGVFGIQQAVDQAWAQTCLCCSWRKTSLRRRWALQRE
jgi:hypothetical protein